MFAIPHVCLGFFVGNHFVEKRRLEEKAWHSYREIKALERGEQTGGYGGMRWRHLMNRYYEIQCEDSRVGWRGFGRWGGKGTMYFDAIMKVQG